VLNKRPTEADLFDFFGDYSVTRNVVDAIFRPDKLMDLHFSIVPEDWCAVNDIA